MNNKLNAQKLTKDLFVGTLVGVITLVVLFVVSMFLVSSGLSIVQYAMGAVVVFSQLFFVWFGLIKVKPYVSMAKQKSLAVVYGVSAVVIVVVLAVYYITAIIPIPIIIFPWLFSAINLGLAFYGKTVLEKEE